MVIPTRDRLSSLQRTLASLARQVFPSNRFEVIVIVDGAEAGALDFLRGYKGPLRLQWAGQAASGAGQARNRGAGLALGKLLLFLDDDVEVSPEVVRAHLEAAAVEECVSMGYLAPVIPRPHGWYEIGLRNWWERKLRDMRQPEHRFEYADLLSGHFSMPAALFRKLGGFDPVLACREDYELGVRLIKAGVRFRFVDRALAWHHETADLRRSFERAKEEGCADVRLARRHNELISGLKLAGFLRTKRACHRWPLKFADPGERSVRCAEGALPWLERLGLRRTWAQCYRRLRHYWYIRGVRAECPDWQEFKRLATARPVEPEERALTVDLACGLGKAEARVESERAASVEIRLHGLRIGTIVSQNLAEPLRPRHLRAHLREKCGFELLVGRAWQRLTNPVSNWK